MSPSGIAKLAPCVVTPIVDIPTARWAELLVKDETQQVSGAFKYRGIRNRMASVLPGSSLVTASTGNHGGGLALAARDLGCTLHVFAPSSTPMAKQERIGRHGAQLHLVHGSYDDCAADAMSLGARHGLEYVHSFDDPQIIQGHQTLFSEIDMVMPVPEVVFVPIGGGGLVSAAIAAWGEQRTRIVGVEHASAPAMAESLRAGRPVILPPLSGPAEGLLVRQVGNHPFAACAAYGLTVETVGDGEIENAIRLLHRVAGIRAEYAGAAAIAAALRHVAPEERALCIVSGGNIDSSRWQRCLEGP
jgi:threonine dehydratase